MSIRDSLRLPPRQLIDELVRITRDSRHSQEVRLAADALLGAMQREREFETRRGLWGRPKALESRGAEGVR